MTQSSWQGKSRGGVTGYRIFVYVLERFGLGAAYVLLRFVVPYFVLFAPAAFASSYRFFRNRLSYSVPRTLSSIYRNFHVFGTTLIDKIALYAGIPTGFSLTHEGVKHINAMSSDGTGGILVSAHMGNWEAASQFLDGQRNAVNIVMMDAEYERLKHFLSRLHRQRRFNVITIDASMDHVYRINAALSRGEIVCLHGDRFLPGAKTAAVDFLGGKAKLPTGPFQIAAATGKPLSFVFAMKDGLRQYHFYATPPKTYSFGDRTKREQDLTAWVQEYALTLEDMVRRYPTQWFNYYDFWNT